MTSNDAHQRHGGNGAGRAYVRFGLMIATSTLTMFLLTYTNLFSIDHAHVSEERIYMAVLMGSAMAIIMLSFMWGSMYQNTKVNVVIIGTALAAGSLALFLSQSQTLVQDEAYMKGMIPHHSIAILTSERAELRDVRVEELASQISDTQVKEIAEMEWLLDDIDDNGAATTDEEARQRPVPEFDAEGQRAEASGREPFGLRASPWLARLVGSQHLQPLPRPGR
ncbi:DUF305 domain-containing protein [Nocardioides coralli]|nr:DUF305 domain-containing protein [Nocardioides coralli]